MRCSLNSYTRYQRDRRWHDTVNESMTGHEQFARRNSCSGGGASSSTAENPKVGGALALHFFFRHHRAWDPPCHCRCALIFSKRCVRAG